jgi:hypothetical protein
LPGRGSMISGARVPQCEGAKDDTKVCKTCRHWHWMVGRAGTCMRTNETKFEDESCGFYVRR